MATADAVVGVVRCSSSSSSSSSRYSTRHTLAARALDAALYSSHPWHSLIHNWYAVLQSTLSLSPAEDLANAICTHVVPCR